VNHSCDISILSQLIEQPTAFSIYLDASLLTLTHILRSIWNQPILSSHTSSSLLSQLQDRLHSMSQLFHHLALIPSVPLSHLSVLERSGYSLLLFLDRCLSLTQFALHVRILSHFHNSLLRSFVLFSVKNRTLFLRKYRSVNGLLILLVSNSFHSSLLRLWLHLVLLGVRI